MNHTEISCIEAYERSSANAANDLLNSVLRNSVLLDVREADEWSAGHAPSAIHSSLG
jgi:rhodanese-related sulfurtransferase